MRLKKILKAAFKLKNLVLLTAVIVITALTSYLPFTLIGLAGYIYFVMQTLKDAGFQKEYAKEEQLDEIEELNRECGALYNEISDTFGKNVKNKVLEVLKEKDELIKYFRENSSDPLRQKIVEQALQLMKAYIRLTWSFNLKGRELLATDVNKIMDRINNNNRKINFMKSPEAVSDLRKAIEMDEELLEKTRNERHELERISARLDYIESMIRTFRYRILSKDDNDPELSEIENVINEATALDNVIDPENRKRMKI